MTINQVAPFINEEELQNLSKTINDKWLSEGLWSKKFIEDLKAISKSKYAVLAPNGTLGLYLSLISLNLPPGSEILLPSFTFFGSASSIVFAGYKPVFVDVSLDDYSMDLDDLQKKITKKTSAIMAIHIYGQISNLDKISKICKENNLILIEDAAQAIGVTYKNIHAGCKGDIGVISFFADKTITTGEGAVIFTQRKKIWERLSLIRNQGRKNSGTFIHQSLGMNFRMTDMQSAIGVAQLKKIGDIKKQRLNTYQLYINKLKTVKGIKFLKLDSNSTFIPFRFPITTIKKNQLMKELEKSNVQTRSFFYPMHLQPPLKKFHLNKKPCKNSKILYDRGIALPIHGDLSESDISHICKIIKKVCEN